MKKLLWTGLLVIASPWWWLLLKYPTTFKVETKDILSYRDQYFTDKVNTYQGLLKSNLIVNKYTWLVKEFSDRGWEALDPGLLFFTGDLNSQRSIRTYGAVLLSLLPAAGLGFLGSSRRKKLIAAIVLAISFVGSGIMPQHFFIPVKIPFLVGFAWMATEGILTVVNKWKNKWQLIYGSWIVIDCLTFAHNLVLHYLPHASL